MYDIDDPRYSGDQDLDSDAVDRSRINADPLSAGLGWFSIALGLAEPAAPRLMARQIGVPDTPWARTAFRQMGTRETGHGVALLMLPSRSAAL